MQKPLAFFLFTDIERQCKSMKSNRMQTLSLVLCLVLLLLVLNQNRKMNEQYEQLENRIHDLQMMLSDEIRGVSSSFAQQLEEADRLVADYALEPKQISKEDKALIADVSVTLKEWYADTQVTLLAQFAGEEFSLPMEHTGSGRFLASLALPLGESYEISMSALISGGGLTKQEDCGAWSDLSMLLPLKNSGSGWSGPNYLNGSLSSNFSVFIEGRDGMPGPIRDPHFLIYRNGELVQTIPAVVDPYSEGSDSVAYTVDTEGNRWHLTCDIGDAIDIRFCCEDEFGLGYDFLFANWVVEGETSANYGSAGYQSGASPLKLYWPE